MSKFSMKKGFTLVELMVVIVIIGILAALAIPRFLGASNKAKATEFKPVLKQIFTLEEAYRQENPTGNYGALATVGWDAPSNSVHQFFNYNLTATAEASGVPGTVGTTAAPAWSATNATLANASPNTNGRAALNLTAADMACVDFNGAMGAATAALGNYTGASAPFTATACP